MHGQLQSSVTGGPADANLRGGNNHHIIKIWNMVEKNKFKHTFASSETQYEEVWVHY